MNLKRFSRVSASGADCNQRRNFRRRTTLVSTHSSLVPIPPPTSPSRQHRRNLRHRKLAINLSNWTTLFSGVASKWFASNLYSPRLPASSAQILSRADPTRTTATPINVTPIKSKTNHNRPNLRDDGWRRRHSLCHRRHKIRPHVSFETTIVNPTLFSMTLVTNITGLPFSGGLIGAVRLGPDDPDSLRRRETHHYIFHQYRSTSVASFTANTDGSSLSLNARPCHQQSRQYFPSLIPASTALPFANYPGTRPSRPTASRRPTAPRCPSQKIGRLQSQSAQGPMPTSILCFPDEITEAARIR